MYVAPVIARVGNLKFYIYPNDHGRPHCHVVHGEAEAKIDLETTSVIRARGFDERTLRKICDKVRELSQDLKDAWNEYQELE